MNLRIISGFAVESAKLRIINCFMHKSRIIVTELLLKVIWLDSLTYFIILEVIEATWEKDSWWFEIVKLVELISPGWHRNRMCLVFYLNLNNLHRVWIKILTRKKQKFQHKSLHFNITFPMMCILDRRLNGTE